ncbi:hypothetical protein MAR_001238 [Mya arenaria]|uniref:Uncharacterized protein n=1 Tax=Mya arenaria TaxID=6604 RepID=A0ABY7FB44_MYAAR|nr:hypothetical protein MAR_001238 [Mya arenaria]
MKDESGCGCASFKEGKAPSMSANASMYEALTEGRQEQASSLSRAEVNWASSLDTTCRHVDG